MKGLFIALPLVLVIAQNGVAQSFSDYISSAEARFNAGDYRGALDDCSKAIELDPESSIAYYNRASAKFALAYYNGAVADYTRAIALNPQLVIAYYNRGNAKYELGDHEGAIADYYRAIKLSRTLLGESRQTQSLQ